MPKIIQHMNAMPYVDAKGRVFKYGEFFPYDISPFAYNETIAQEYYPLSRKEVSDFGFRWYDRVERDYRITMKEADIPDAAGSVPDAIIKEVIECANQGLEKSGCTTAFRVTPQELAFYKKLNLPLPHFCPNCRHFNRVNKRNPMKLWIRKCMCNLQNHVHEGACPNIFETIFSPEKLEIIFREECYQKEAL